jgi:hypothetical protein
VTTDGPTARIHIAPAPAEAPLPPNPPGLVLLRRLGVGGMGVVYLAADPETRRFVAVKLLHAPGDPGSYDRFQGEVRALAELNHPHIVTVFAANLHHHTPYYVMELVSGGTLSRYVTTHGPLEPRTAAELVATVSRAAHGAHQRAIVHRDIKPGNVLLITRPQPAAEPPADGPNEPTLAPAPTLVPKLSDFGLAKRIDRNEGLTAGSGALGTPHFMAPEQTRGALVTPRTDVYGLGATLYFALTGEAPFEGEGEDLRALMFQVQAREPRRVRALRPAVPLDLEAVVHKCLEKDPANRYESAAELAAELDRFLADQPVLAHPLTPLRRARKAVLRKRRALGRFALAALALAAVFSLGAVLSGSSEDQDAKALKKMQAALAAKKDVALIGATGEPRWHKWIHGPGAFVPVPGREDACSFQAFGASMLDLCPDPMTERYRLHAELCQWDVNERDQEGQPPGGGDFEIGFYFGRQTAIGNNGWQSDICLCVRFTEAPKAVAGRARFGRLADSTSPTERNRLSRSELRSVPFTCPNRVPGWWHIIEAEVTPVGVKVWFDATETNPGPFANVTVAEITRWYTAPLTGVQKLDPNHGTPLPAWNPRGALGVWSYSSAVAVRNVTVTPLE